MRHIPVGGADGDSLFGVAWAFDGKREPAPGVSGGNHHRDAGLHQPVDFNANRALPTGEPLGIEIVSYAQVHTVDDDLPAESVNLLNLVESRDDITDGPLAG